jgi:hypothetical protein
VVECWVGCADAISTPIAPIEAVGESRENLYAPTHTPG